MSHQYEKQLQEAANAINSATHIFITAGAGLGVDSGLPDFRGTEGFWRAYPPMAKLKLKLEDTSTPRWFKDDKHFAWGFFGHRYDLYTKAIPHQGYHILKEFVDAKTDEDAYFCFTSNVDGHFAKVFPEDKILECHGSLMHMQCTNPEECRKSGIWPVSEHTHGPSLPLDIDMETFRAKDPLPMCRSCERLARPNVMMFNDDTVNFDRIDEQEQAFKKWLRKTENAKEKKVVVIEIGAGEYVPSVRNKSEAVARRLGDNSVLIRINPRDHQIEPRVVNGGISIPMGGLAALEAIKQRM